MSAIGHGPHLLSTRSAVQILTLYDGIHVINVDKVVAYVQSLQMDPLLEPFWGRN